MGYGIENKSIGNFGQNIDLKRTFSTCLLIYCEKMTAKFKKYQLLKKKKYIFFISNLGFFFFFLNLILLSCISKLYLLKIEKKKLPKIANIGKRKVSVLAASMY